MHGRGRRALGALGLAASVLATSACGPPQGPATADATAPFPGVEDAVRPSEGRVEPPTVERMNFRAGQPTAVFGRREVAQGYAEAVWFAAATTFATRTMVPGPSWTATAFLRHTDRMTDEWATTHRETVDDCFAGDSAACGTMDLTSYYWLDHDGYRLQRSGPLVVDHEIHEAGVWVTRWEGEDQLAVRFEQRGGIRVRKKGEDYVIPLIKDATYWLAPAPEGTDHGWQVDGVDASYVVRPAEPDTGGY